MVLALFLALLLVLVLVLLLILVCAALYYFKAASSWPALSYPAPVRPCLIQSSPARVSVLHYMSRMENKNQEPSPPWDKLNEPDTLPILHRQVPCPRLILHIWYLTHYSQSHPSPSAVA